MSSFREYDSDVLMISADFDAFATTVGEVDGVTLLQNPRRRSWSLSSADLSGVHIQLGRLGSGNIFEGQSWAHGTVFYLPLTDTCTYLGWGTPIEKDALMIAAPSSEFFNQHGVRARLVLDFHSDRRFRQ